MRKKSLHYTIATFVAITSALIFYNSSVDDDPFHVDSALKILMAIFSGLLGMNELIEMIDHTHPHQHHHEEAELLGDRNSQDYNSIENGEPTEQGNKLLGKEIMTKSVITLSTFPFLAAALYGLYTQSESLIETFGVDDDRLIKTLALIPTFPLAARFGAIPVAHTYKNIWGGREAFTKLVTGAEGPISQFSPYWLRYVIFLTLCGTHLLEGFLLSNEIDQGWIQVLSVLGLTMSRAVAHLDHIDAMPNAFRQWLTYNVKTRCITSITGFFSGVVHASPAVISTLYFWDAMVPVLRALMMLAIGIEAFTGGLEHQQHGGRWIGAYVSQQASASYSMQ